MKILLLFFLFYFINSSYAQKPNILWITIEDTSPQFIGCYGNKQARTPVIDSLAKNGTRFVNAFSTGSVCSPSRSAIITGVRSYELGTGHHRSSYPIPDSIKGFPWYLREVGYYTTNNSKTDYNTSDAKRIISESWNENSGNAGWWNRAPGQPFFAVFNYMESHQGRTMTFPYEKYKKEIFDQLKTEERIGDGDFDMPPFYHDSPEMRKQLARVYNALKLTDNLIGNLLQRLKKDKLADSTIIFFYGDHGEGIPGAKTNGIGLGYRVPFVIWFPPMYKHLSPWRTGMVTDEMINFEDLAPTLLSLAGVKIPSYMKGRAITGADRTPQSEFIFCTQDRADESADLARSVTNGRYLYSRNFMPFMPEHRWIRYQEISDIKKEIRKDFAAGKLNDIQKRMLEPRPAEFLFDLVNDTWEINNLVNEPSMKPWLEKMRSAMEENIIQSRDILFLPEYEMALIAKKVLPYHYRLNDENYPVKQIYAAASLSGKRDKSIAHRQLDLLKNKNKIVRYWAAMGLKSQSAEILKSHQLQLEAALKDAYPPVQILAASMCYDLFNDKKAQNILADYCLHEDENLSLLALQNIAYVKNMKPFATSLRQVNVRGRKHSLNLYVASEVLMYRLGLQNLQVQEE